MVEQTIPKEDPEKTLAHIKGRLDDIAREMEKTGIAEYVEMLHRPRRLLFLNFWIGLARGFGMAIGFTFLAALVVYFLQHIIMLNIPVIGHFIAELVDIVRSEMRIGP